MFDLGWDEMAVIAVVALVVLGPKELPNALRTVTGFMRQARKLAGEFQNGVHQIIREAELEDAKKAIAELNKNSISDAIEKHVDAGGEIKSALQVAKDEPASPAAADAPALAATSAEAAIEAEPNPAVAAFAPGGSATRLPDVAEVEAPAEASADGRGEVLAHVDGDPRATPVEAGHDAELRQAAASTLAGEAEEAGKKIRPEQEVSKTS